MFSSIYETRDDNEILDKQTICSFTLYFPANYMGSQFTGWQFILWLVF